MHVLTSGSPRPKRRTRRTHTQQEVRSSGQVETLDPEGSPEKYPRKGESVREGEVNTLDPSAFRRRNHSVKSKRGSTTPTTNTTSKTNGGNVNYDQDRVAGRDERVDRHDPQRRERREERNEDHSPEEGADEEGPPLGAAEAGGDGDPSDDPDGSEESDSGEGSDRHEHKSDESEPDDSSEEYRRKAEELQRKYKYEQHKRRKAERRRRQQTRKQPPHRKHERKKHGKKHHKHRREERRKYTRDLYETPVSDEGSESDDQYYHAPEVFRASSARVYDPYDLKGIVAPQLNYGDDGTRETFRVKYLDYVTKHKAKMRKRASRDRVVECMKPSLLVYVCCYSVNTFWQQSIGQTTRKQWTPW